MSELAKRKGKSRTRDGVPASSVQKPEQAAGRTGNNCTAQEVKRAAEAVMERNREALTELAKW